MIEVKTGISLNSIKGPSRKATIQNVRIVYWLVLHEAGYTYKAIGAFTNRYYATVWSGVRRAKGLLKSNDKEMKRIYNLLKYD